MVKKKTSFKKQGLRTKNTLSLITGFIILFVVLLLDHFIKFFTTTLALGESITLIPGVLWFTHATNTGVAFGLFQGNNALLIWLTIMIFGVFLYWYDEFDTQLSSTAYWLIMAGLFGNLLDRIFRGHVVDMFNLGWFPIFNIADSAITIAVVLLLVNELLLFRKERAKKK